MQVTLDRIESHTPTIKTFWFATDHALDYVAGQFIELTLPQVPEGMRNRRWFTLSSSPTEHLLGITTKFKPSGNSPFKDVLLNLSPGDITFMSEPMGDFVLPMQKNMPLLFVAAGMGITPVRSMAKWLTDTDQARPAKLLYAVHTPEDLLFADILHQAGLSPVFMTRHNSTEWQGEVGSLTIKRILSGYPEGGLLYISGPELFTEQLVHDLKEAGFPSSKLVTDYFPGYEPV